MIGNQIIYKKILDVLMAHLFIFCDTNGTFFRGAWPLFPQRRDGSSPMGPKVFPPEISLS